MNDTPIQIRNPEVVRAIRDLAKKTGLPLTDAVGDAVREKLQGRGAVSRAEFERRLAAIKDISRRGRELPIIGPTPTDDDFYDEDGLPRRRSSMRRRFWR